jgi:dihydrolipoamide dehydrogenase
MADGFDYDVLVIGSGPGGYVAAIRAAQLGLKTACAESRETLGGTCLNVGCIPSKALLHASELFDEAAHGTLAKWGIKTTGVEVDLDAMHGSRKEAVKGLTQGVEFLFKKNKVEWLKGQASFASADTVKVGDRTVRAKNIVIATGSSVTPLPGIEIDQQRIVDSTGALELAKVPKRMLILGGGIIGLEMGTVYSTLGARLDVVEMLDGLMQGADRDLVRVWQKMNTPRFDNIMLKTKTVGAEATKDGILVKFEGEQAPKEPQVYDLVLQAVGRSPNGKKIGAENAGVNVTDRGFIPVDIQMRTNVPHIFAIGDIVGNPMLAHKAVHEGHVAAEAAFGEKSTFDARVIPSVAYTDPEVAWVGLTEDQAKAQNIAITKGHFPWTASGRAIANGRDEGFTKLLFDAETHRILGGGIVGTHAGDMIGEIALAIEMGADEVDIGKTIHPHPTLGESIGMAAEIAHGTCTDVPPPRR